MTTPSDCNQNTDTLKLIREGTSQEQRVSAALDPAYAPVNERRPEHGMVFAQAYSAFLRYVDENNAVVGDWQPFFSRDVSVQLAVAATQDVAYYQQQVKASFDYLNSLEHASKPEQLKQHLGYLFSYIGTLAFRLDSLKEALPDEIALKAGLQNLIQGQLAPAFRRLLAYYKADRVLPAPHPLIAQEAPDLSILGTKARAFSEIYSNNFSKDWITDASATWADYTLALTPDASVYGAGVDVFERCNHLSTHALFTAAFDQFLKVYARVVSDARQALADSFTHRDDHEPHYALFIAFLRLFEHARAGSNTLTGRHLDFYYRDILKLKEKPAQPGHAHLLLELAKQAEAYELKAGRLFKAGKDSRGNEAFFASDLDFVANSAQVLALKTLYRHKNLPNESLPFQDQRLFASPVANSEDGLGAKLTREDQSWHPFFNKIYADGTLSAINMPNAETGFAVASHYLWMAEGERTITLAFTLNGASAGLMADHKDDVACLVTTEKGWLEKTATKFVAEAGILSLELKLSGADPAITPYLAKTHGYAFATGLPVLAVKLKHDDNRDYIYALLQDAVCQKIDLTVSVEGLRTLAVSNDFGPVDTSKPFQPFGAQPVNGASLTVGSREVFQKQLQSAALQIGWQNPPGYYNSQAKDAGNNLVATASAPKINVAYLAAGSWSTPAGNFAYSTTEYALGNAANTSVVDAADLAGNEVYNAAARYGYVRLVLDGDTGFKQYQIDLGNFLAKIFPKPLVHPGAPVLGPFANVLTMAYTATQDITLIADDKQEPASRFFHLAPFGQPVQLAPSNADVKAYLLPQFKAGENPEANDSEAEFYIGLGDLKPPQNLALLFQVADGTADPLSNNPAIHWSYLCRNEWVGFAPNEVEDQTGGLLNSGIISFAVPAKASADNTLLPAGMHWLRAAVTEESDAVCRLRMVAAQALKATFADKGNDPDFPAAVLMAGTISKLDSPDAAVKKISQPFETFGGRGAEPETAFYTRISERLRHKDRAIVLWDYERLVLEAFPQIYKAKCLNHTQYEPNESGTGIYRELAPGHVTVVTLPNQQFQHLRDPLRPYTSLALLEDIKAFLHKRLSCFVRLHVKNPQFEEVSAAFKVRLQAGADETFQLRKLQEAVTRFLSPWAFSDAASPSFGGKIHQSVLLNFVEELPYVDYVTDFQLFHYLIIDGVKQKLPKIEIEGSKAVSILVSVPAHLHEISAINPAEAEAPATTCPCAT